MDGKPEAVAVTDATGPVGDGGAAVARAGQRDAGQSAGDVRDRDGYLADRDVGAGVPAGWPLDTDKLRVWPSRPAHGLTVTAFNTALRLETLTAKLFHDMNYPSTTAARFQFRKNTGGE